MRIIHFRTTEEEGIELRFMVWETDYSLEDFGWNFPKFRTSNVGTEKLMLYKRAWRAPEGNPHARRCAGSS